MKRLIRRLPGYEALRGMWSVWYGTLRYSPQLGTRIAHVRWFFAQLRVYKKIAKLPFLFLWAHVAPHLWDHTGAHDEDPAYFYQDSWCAARIFAATPQRHVDVGSKLDMVGILSQFVPTTMIDIRPADVHLPGLTFMVGDVTKLPLATNSTESLSSICVIEHIGLGRYGDTLDSEGTTKAARELARVLKPGGNLYISVPVEGADTVYFNAHRAFTRESVLLLFSTLTLKDESYIYGRRMEERLDMERSGIGLYHFTK